MSGRSACQRFHAVGVKLVKVPRYAVAAVVRILDSAGNLNATRNRTSPGNANAIFFGRMDGLSWLGNALGPRRVPVTGQVFYQGKLAYTL